ncbi:MAG: 30S ribosomal protein S16 [Cryomorphaceae bacterium]
MSTRIRLQRHGKKGKPFFHIVVADQRSKRDGRFIEKIGTYNPNTNPATIVLDFEKSLDWIQKGAQPSDTARAILSYRGVLMMDHLKRGVVKGALTEDQAKAKFDKWLEDKEGNIQKKRDGLASSAADERKARLAAEREANEARIASLSAQEEAAEESAEAAEAAEGAVETMADAATDAAEAVVDAAESAVEAVVEAVEEVADAITPTEEAPAEPAKEETPAEETKAEASAEEAKEEAPAAETKAEETPAEGEEEKKEA